MCYGMQVCYMDWYDVGWQLEVLMCCIDLVVSWYEWVNWMIDVVEWLCYCLVVLLLDCQVWYQVCCQWLVIMLDWLDQYCDVWCVVQNVLQKILCEVIGFEFFFIIGLLYEFGFFGELSECLVWLILLCYFLLIDFFLLFMVMFLDLDDVVWLLELDNELLQ